MPGQRGPLNVGDVSILNKGGIFITCFLLAIERFMANVRQCNIASDRTLNATKTRNLMIYSWY